MDLRRNITALAVVAVLSSAAYAEPSPPTGVIVAAAGQVLRFDGDGARCVLASCEVHRRARLGVPPYSERTETEPCSLSSLVTHERLERWIVSVAVQRFPSTISETYVVDGQPVPLTSQRSGTFFLLGDARGFTRHAMPPPTAWYDEDQKMIAAWPERFSADGATVLLTVQAGSNARPVSWQLPFTRSEQVTRLRGQVELRLVDGDDRYEYRPGKTMVQGVGSWASVTCDPAAPGTWRRINLRTGREEVLKEDDWCRTGTAEFVGKRAGTRAVILNQLGHDKRRRLYRHDKLSQTTTEVAFEGSLARTPLAIDAAGDLVLAVTHQEGLVLLDTNAGALVWRAGALPGTGSNIEGLSGAFVSAPGQRPLVGQPFLADGRSVAVGRGASDLRSDEKMKSFFERRAFGTAHHVVSGVHLAEVSNRDTSAVAARLRAGVRSGGPGWSVLAAWPAALERGTVTTLPITAGAAGGTCEPFDLASTGGGRLAFVDWQDDHPEVIACAISGTLTVDAQPDGTLGLTVDVTFDDGSSLRGTRYTLSPVRGASAPADDERRR